MLAKVKNADIAAILEEEIKKLRKEKTWQQRGSNLTDRADHDDQLTKIFLFDIILAKEMTVDSTKLLL